MRPVLNQLLHDPDIHSSCCQCRVIFSSKEFQAVNTHMLETLRVPVLTSSDEEKKVSDIERMILSQLKCRMKDDIGFKGHNSTGFMQIDSSTRILKFSVMRSTFTGLDVGKMPLESHSMSVTFPRLHPRIYIPD